MLNSALERRILSLFFLLLFFFFFVSRSSFSAGPAAVAVATSAASLILRLRVPLFILSFSLPFLYLFPGCWCSDLPELVSFPTSPYPRGSGNRFKSKKRGYI